MTKIKLGEDDTQKIGKYKIIWVRKKSLHENTLIIKALVCLLVPPPIRKEGRHRSKLLCVVRLVFPTYHDILEMKQPKNC